MSRISRLLPIVCIMALLASDLMAVRHAASCCGLPAAGSGLLRETIHGEVNHGEASSHDRAGCCHASHCFAASKARWQGQNHLPHEHPASGQPAGDETPAHDSDDCSLCRWLTTARSDSPLLAVAEAVEPQPLVSELAIESATHPAGLFLSSLSRRGPPTA
jgi:hypothetical protein